jgi:hypothetical protein
MEMIERVARAMVEAANNADTLQVRMLPSPDQSEIMARAAIEAMREPTEAMLIDGAAKIRNFTSVKGLYPRTRAVWLSMIDASLANHLVLPDSSSGHQVND